MSRGEQLARQWQFLRVLENHRYGLALSELSSILECSQRTLERDIQALVEMGFPIQSEKREHGKKYWKLTSRFIESDNLILSPTEIISLYLANQLINPLAGTYLEDGWQHFLKKIQSLLPSTVLSHFSELEDTLYVKSPQTPKAISPTYLKDIRKAIKQSVALSIDYQRDAHPFSVTLHPYGLIVYENTFYVIGFAEEVDNIRTFKLQRIRNIKVTKKSFQRPDDFSLEKSIKGSFGVYGSKKKKGITVRCELKDWAARTVREQKWHPTQIIEKDDGKALVVSFLLHTTVEFMRWILGFGAMAKVLEPQEIRKKIAAELEKTLDSYNK